MRIGQLSQATGVSVQAIRYYERFGVFEKPPRNKIGHRLYGPDACHAIYAIKEAQRRGFKLSEIREIKEASFCDELHLLIAGVLERLREKERQVRQSQKEINDLCSDCHWKAESPAADCPIYKSLRYGEYP